MRLIDILRGWSQSDRSSLDNLSCMEQSGHDHSYKLLFSHPEMIADLIRGYVREPWVERVDLSTLERVSGSYVTDDLASALG